MSKVCVICTGGTISMLDLNDSSQCLTTLFDDEVRKILPSSKHFPTVDFIVYSPLIDSSEMTVDVWNKIGNDIRSKYHDYDGFVIFHGTDTMAYTGSALSFMLGNLNKPVILTGAQTPLSSTINDARENIIHSIYIAGNYHLNEVCICFNRSIYRANRATKFSTDDCDAYISPNYPLLGRVQSSVEIDSRMILKEPDKSELTVTMLESHDIRYIPLTPYLQPDVFEKMIEGASAVIIGSYGDGNIRIRDQRFLDIIKRERDNGMIFINKSQCLHSNTIPRYDAGALLVKVGIVSAGDQTVEAITAKLTYFLSKKMKPSEIENAMQQSLRGELTSAVKLVQKYSFFQSAGTSDMNNIVSTSVVRTLSVPSQ